MATVYGGYDTSAGYDAYRAVMDYSTSQTDTQWTVSITGKVQSGYGADSLDNFALSLTIGDSTESKSSTSYMSTGSTVTFGSKSRTYSRGHSAVNCLIKAYAKNDGTYTGWTGSSTASATVTIPAKPSYAVTYSANGGSGAPSSQTKWHGEELTLSSTRPTRTGYAFLGWSTSSTATSATYAAGGSYTANAAATLYAVWKVNTYAVTYSANGGSGAPSSQTKTYGVDLTLSSTRPTRTGYAFQGWATSSTSTTVAYSPGARYTSNAALALYAVWRINTYTVSYNANGGSGAPSSQTKTYGASVTLASAISRASGSTRYTVTYNYNGSGASSTSATATKTTSYTFSKWNTKADGSGTNYAAGASYSANASLSLYATWTSSALTTSVTLPTPTRTGYTFGGWYRESACTNKVGNGGASYTPTASITLYAKWTLSSWTVSYDANGGSGAPASQTKVSGQTLTLSSTEPRRSGYTFLGWSTNKAGTGTAYAPGGSYTANAAATLYAVWAGVQVTSLSVFRSDSAGARDTDGAYGHLSAGWKAIGTIAGTVSVTATAGAADITTSLSNRTGSKTATADLSNTSAATFGGSYAESTSVKVTVTATLTVSYGGSTTTVTASRVATIPKVFHLLTFLHDGTGLAIGAMATLSSTFEVALQTVFNNVMVSIKAPNIDRDGATLPSSNTYSRPFRVADADGDALAYYDGYRLTTGETGVRLVAYAGPSGDAVYNSLRVGKMPDGTNVYYVSDQAAFRNAINAVRASDQEAQNVLLSPMTGTTQLGAWYWNVTNANSSASGDRVAAIFTDGSLRMYDSTGEAYFWTAYTTANKPTAADVGLTTTTSSPSISNATATTFQLRKYGNVVQLSVYGLNVSASLADGSSVSLGSGVIPSGMRPSAAVYAPIAINSSTNGTGLFLYVTAGGNVSLYNRTGSSLPTSTNVNCNATWIVA